MRLYQDMCNRQAPMPGVSVPDMQDHTRPALHMAEHGDDSALVSEFQTHIRDALLEAGLATKYQ